MDDPTSLIALAESAAREAGTLLLDALHAQHRGVATKTSSTDMVSEMDHAAEKLILDRLLAARPDDAVLAEEGGSREGTSGVRWIIDPLDGTTNYLYGHPRWSVSVAAERQGEVVAGAVAEPGLDDVFTAAKGHGAFLNGEPISHSGHDDLGTSLIATGFGYKPEQRAAQAAVLTTLLPAVRDIRRGGVASLDLCWVACGRVDGYYEAVLQPWDVAAGILIATEAGAVCRAIDGGPPSGASIVAAAPGIVDALLSLLQRAGGCELPTTE